MQYLTIELPVSLWQRVDGCVDNSMALDVVDAIMESVIAGSCVREAGWRAAAAFSGIHDPFGWPAPDQLLPITLRRSHWEWTLSQLEHWQSYETDGTVVAAQRIIGDAIQAA